MTESNTTYRELLLGCGHARDKRIRCPSNMTESWRGLVTLDSNRAVEPDILADLNHDPWSIESAVSDLIMGKVVDVVDVLPGGDDMEIRENCFDEVHAYEVIEHLGRQGDYRAFFAFFTEVWRVLKPGGYLAGTCPSRYSSWLWGDPGHTRAILPETLLFLSQPAYSQCDDKGPMSDYRGVYAADFDRIRSEDDRTLHRFLLQAVKPARGRHAGG